MLRTDTSATLHFEEQQTKSAAQVHFSDIVEPQTNRISINICLYLVAEENTNDISLYGRWIPNERDWVTTMTTKTTTINHELGTEERESVNLVFFVDYA